MSAVFDETSNWFRDDIDKKRFEISRLIMNTSNSYANSSKITFPELQFFPTAAEDKCEKRKELEKTEIQKVYEGTKQTKLIQGEDYRKANICKKEAELDIRQSYLDYIEHIKQNQKDLTLRRKYHFDTSTSTSTSKKRCKGD